jgi:hypothetical protein
MQNLKCYKYLHQKQDLISLTALKSPPPSPGISFKGMYQKTPRCQASRGKPIPLALTKKMRRKPSKKRSGSESNANRIAKNLIHLVISHAATRGEWQMRKPQEKLSK